MQQKAADIKVKLSEIFTSVEGEGILFGTKTMFVRMAGCPLKCHWCDTAYAIPMESGTSYSLDQVKGFIRENLYPNTYKVNFTGGEPLVQHEAVIELAKFVKEVLRLRTYLESACYDSARFAKVLPYMDICKVEFKTKDSKVVEPKNYDSLIRNEFECLRLSVGNKKTTYVKIVVTNSTHIEEFKDLVNGIFKIVSEDDIAGFIIQPSHKSDEPSLDRLFAFYDAVFPHFNQVRIIPQLHKIIGAR